MNKLQTRHFRQLKLSNRNFTSTGHNKSTLGRPVYEYVENVENLAGYEPGGYHAVAIGDYFHQRYRIVHKLGHGAFSTICLANDQRLKKYVALKIATADGGAREADVLSQLAAIQHISTSIPAIWDRFEVNGPNGRHQCLVMEAARCSLADCKVASWVRLFPIQRARSLAAQLVTALGQIHKHGYIHGDLHLGNILLKIPRSLDKLSEKQLYERFDSPEPQLVRRQDGSPLPPNVPQHVYESIWMGVPTEDLAVEEASITVTDFGVAFNPSEEIRLKSYTPLEIRPPESRFEPDTPLTFSSDIWSLVAQRPIFGEILPTHDIITSQQINALGTLPAEWSHKWKSRLEYFTEDGQPIECHRSPTWDERFERDIQAPRKERKLGMMDEKEKEAFTYMLRWMLAYKPEDRPTVKQVMQTDWMREYEFPASQQR